MTRFFAVHENQRGFTMIEIMITLVLVGILAALAGPEFLNQMTRLETKAQIRDLTSELREARSLAVARKEPCGLCVLYDGSWVVFVDRDLPPNGTYETSTDSALVTGHIGNRVAMAYNSFNNGTVCFGPNGSATQSGAMCISSEDGVLCYTVDVLAATGRVKMVEGYYPSGIISIISN